MKAFRHTASYDAAISGYLDNGEGDKLHERIAIDLERVQTLRYGENPHQKGALYRLGARGGFSLCDAEVLGGKELSFNNLLDAASAAELAHDLEGIGCAIIKHTNPCGVGLGDTQETAYERALVCDPVSAFGSVIGYNRKVTAQTAEAMRSLFVEVVVAPGFDDEALAIMRKKKNLIILRMDGLGGDSGPAGLEVRSIPGGVLMQERDSLSEQEFRWEVVTSRAPSMDEEKALRIAWRVARHVEEQRHRHGRQEWYGWRWRGPDESGRLHPTGCRARRFAACRMRLGVRCLFPVPRRNRHRCLSRREGDSPAGWIHAR